jgi:hypothetical protein
MLHKSHHCSDKPRQCLAEQTIASGVPHLTVGNPRSWSHVLMHKFLGNHGTVCGHVTPLWSERIAPNKNESMIEKRAVANCFVARKYPVMVITGTTGQR